MSRRIDAVRWGAVLLAGVLLAGGAAAEKAAGAEAQAARDTVRAASDDILAVLREEGLSSKEKRDRIESMAERYFDFPTISKLVLGRTWRDMTPQQRTDFEGEFKRHLSVTYGGGVDRFDEQEVEITDARVERNGDVTVRTRIVGGAEPVLVDYRMRSQSSDWRVIDVIIENVSTISNFRSQTQEIVGQKGVDGLIETLREKNARREAEAEEAS